VRWPPVQLSPKQKTFLLSVALTLGAAALILQAAGARPILVLHLPAPFVALGLVVLFVLAEQLLMNVEFRRQAHSLTLAGVPLALGILLASPDTLVIARVVGSLAALTIQRISFDKVFYNVAAYAFEAALAVTAINLITSPRASLDLIAATTVIGVIAAGDQFMSLLVLGVIRMHNGPLSRRDVGDVLLPAVTLSIITSAFAVVIVLLLGHGALGDILVLILVIVVALAYRGYVETSRRHQALALVHDFVAGGVGAESVEALSEQLLIRIRGLLRAESAELVILETAVDSGDVVSGPGMNPDPLVLVLSVGEDEILRVSQRQFDHSDWVSTRALGQEEPMLAARNTKDRGLRRWLTDRDLRDAIVVPLTGSNDLKGTLTVADRLGETATFTHDDLTLLQTLTGHLAVAVRSTRLVEKLGYDATHDSLTGLPNRALLTHRIHTTLATASAPVGVLLLDLDRFKEVNDALGHDVGDRLLTVVGDRLRGCVPPTATVARLGGDEFAVLLPELPDGPDSAVTIAEAVADALSQPVQFEEALLTPEASVGVAVTGADRRSDLLRQADTAMYSAKTGDQRVAVYTPEMDRGRVERLALLADLRTALEFHPEQLIVHYQPKIDLTDGRVVSAEALVRWLHPTLGVLVPDRFIALAESTGLIEALTSHVLDVALTDCRDWTARGQDISVAVNLSARNVGDPKLPGRVAQALERACVPASSLILEITESSVMGDPEQTVPILHQLADLGLCLSLDDFGTGYSSLSYLQRLPVGEVKIDRSFVLGLAAEDPRNSQALIRSITGLGANLGLRVVAEGVEDEERMTQLRELGCHVAQGYCISRPLALKDLHAWLIRNEQSLPPRLRLLSPGA
jgi:diguanylate cyclase (GGDEF)-like protein